MEFSSSNMQPALHLDPPMETQADFLGTDEELQIIPKEFLSLAELDIYHSAFSPVQNTSPTLGLSPYEMELEEVMASLNHEAQLRLQDFTESNLAEAEVGGPLPESSSLTPYTDIATTQLDNVTKQARNKVHHEGTTWTNYDQVVSMRKSRTQTCSVDNKLKSSYVIDGMRQVVEFQDKGHQGMGASQSLLNGAANNSSSRETPPQTLVQAGPNRAGISYNKYANELNAEHSYTSKGRREMASSIAQKNPQENISGPMHGRSQVTSPTTSRAGDYYTKAKPKPIPKPHLWSTQKGRVVPVKTHREVTRTRDLDENASTPQPNAQNVTLLPQKGKLLQNQSTTASSMYPKKSARSKIQGPPAINSPKTTKYPDQPYPVLLFAPTYDVPPCDAGASCQSKVVADDEGRFGETRVTSRQQRISSKNATAGEEVEAGITRQHHKTGGKTRYIYSRSEQSLFARCFVSLSTPRCFQCVKCSTRFPIHKKTDALIHAQDHRPDKRSKEKGEDSFPKVITNRVEPENQVFDVALVETPNLPNHNRVQHRDTPVVETPSLQSAVQNSKQKSRAQGTAQSKSVPSLPKPCNRKPRHKRGKQGSLKCPLCPKTFRQKEPQRKHIIRCCKIGKPSVPPSQNKIESRPTPSSKSTNRKRLALFACEECSFKTTQLARLFHHKERHTPRSPKHRCYFPNCKRYFARKRTLKSHEETHMNEADKTHACPHCGKKFGFQINALAHTKMCLAAPLQNSSSSFIGSLSVHRNDHTLQRNRKMYAKNPPYHCEVCKAICLQALQYTLTSHLGPFHNDEPAITPYHDVYKACCSPEPSAAVMKQRTKEADKSNPGDQRLGIFEQFPIPTFS